MTREQIFLICLLVGGVVFLLWGLWACKDDDTAMLGILIATPFAMIAACLIYVVLINPLIIYFWSPN